jgi:hypothetical protein
VITPLHVERGRQMRSVLEHDVAVRGMTAWEATTSLAEYLGVEVETVRLAVAIANAADAGAPIVGDARDRALDAERRVEAAATEAEREDWLRVADAAWAEVHP